MPTLDELAQPLPEDLDRIAQPLPKSSAKDLDAIAKPLPQVKTSPDLDALAKPLPEDLDRIAQPLPKSSAKDLDAIAKPLPQVKTSPDLDALAKPLPDHPSDVGTSQKLQSKSASPSPLALATGYTGASDTGPRSSGLPSLPANDTLGPDFKDVSPLALATGYEGASDTGPASPRKLPINPALGSAITNTAAKIEKMSTPWGLRGMKRDDFAALPPVDRGLAFADFYRQAGQEVLTSPLRMGAATLQSLGRSLQGLGTMFSRDMPEKVSPLAAATGYAGASDAGEAPAIAPTDVQGDNLPLPPLARYLGPKNLLTQDLGSKTLPGAAMDVGTRAANEIGLAMATGGMQGPVSSMLKAGTFLGARQAGETYQRAVEENIPNPGRAAAAAGATGFLLMALPFSQAGEGAMANVMESLGLTGYLKNAAAKAGATLADAEIVHSFQNAVQRNFDPKKGILDQDGILDDLSQVFAAKVFGGMHHAATETQIAAAKEKLRADLASPKGIFSFMPDVPEAPDSEVTVTKYPGKQGGKLGTLTDPRLVVAYQDIEAKHAQVESSIESGNLDPAQARHMKAQNDVGRQEALRDLLAHQESIRQGTSQPIDLEQRRATEPMEMTYRDAGGASRTVLLTAPDQIQRYQDRMAQQAKEIDALKQQPMTSAERAAAIYRTGEDTRAFKEGLHRESLPAGPLPEGPLYHATEDQIPSNGMDVSKSKGGMWGKGVSLGPLETSRKYLGQREGQIHEVQQSVRQPFDAREDRTYGTPDLQALGLPLEGPMNGMEVWRYLRDSDPASGKLTGHPDPEAAKAYLQGLGYDSLLHEFHGQDAYHVWDQKALTGNRPSKAVQSILGESNRIKQQIAQTAEGVSFREPGEPVTVTTAAGTKPVFTPLDEKLSPLERTLNVRNRMADLQRQFDRIQTGGIGDRMLAAEHLKADEAVPEGTKREVQDWLERREANEDARKAGQQIPYPETRLSPEGQAYRNELAGLQHEEQAHFVQLRKMKGGNLPEFDENRLPRRAVEREAKNDKLAISEHAQTALRASDLEGNHHVFFGGRHEGTVYLNPETQVPVEATTLKEAQSRILAKADPIVDNILARAGQQDDATIQALSKNVDQAQKQVQEALSQREAAKAVLKAAPSNQAQADTEALSQHYVTLKAQLAEAQDRARAAKLSKLPAVETLANDPGLKEQIRQVKDVEGEVMEARRRFNPSNQDPSQVKLWTDKDGHLYELGRSTSREIEDKTGIPMSHSPKANLLDSIVDLRSALRTKAWLDKVVSTPGMALPKAEGIPQGYKELGPNAMRVFGERIQGDDLAFVPKLADTLKELADNFGDRKDPTKLEELSRWIVQAGFAIPTVHWGNMLPHFLAASRAFTSNPGDVLDALDSAYRDVQAADKSHITPGMKDYLASAGKLMARPGLADAYRESLEKAQGGPRFKRPEWEVEPGTAHPYSNPDNAVGRMNREWTWKVDDIFRLASARLAAARGPSLSEAQRASILRGESSPEAQKALPGAVEDVRKLYPDYNIGKLDKYSWLVHGKYANALLFQRYRTGALGSAVSPFAHAIEGKLNEMGLLNTGMAPKAVQKAQSAIPSELATIGGIGAATALAGQAMKGLTQDKDSTFRTGGPWPIWGMPAEAMKGKGLAAANSLLSFTPEVGLGLKLLAGMNRPGDKLAVNPVDFAHLQTAMSQNDPHGAASAIANIGGNYLNSIATTLNYSAGPIRDAIQGSKDPWQTFLRTFFKGSSDMSPARQFLLASSLGSGGIVPPSAMEADQKADLARLRLALKNGDQAQAQTLGPKLPPNVYLQTVMNQAKDPETQIRTLAMHAKPEALVYAFNFATPKERTYLGPEIVKKLPQIIKTMDPESRDELIRYIQNTRR